MSDHGRFIWYELMTPDMAGARAFYGDVVGWTSSDMPGAEGAYALFGIGGRDVAGLMPLGDEHRAHGVPPNWTAYVAVDDCDAAAAKVKSLGGSVMREPQDIPGIGRFAIVADPAGAVIAIMKPTPPEGGRPEAPEAARATPDGTSSTATIPSRASASTRPCSLGSRTRPTTWGRWASTSCSATRMARSAA